MKLLIEIVLVFIKIQLLSFGGGHASIPIVQNEIVEVKHWMSIQEFSDLLAMDELTPGPLAINCATYVGQHLAGFKGALAATIGSIIPSCVIAIIFSRLYKKYFENKLFVNILRALRCMVIALLAYTTIYLFTGTILVDYHIKFEYLILFGISFFVLYKYRPNPIYVMLSSGAISLLLRLIFTA